MLAELAGVCSAAIHRRRPERDQSRNYERVYPVYVRQGLVWEEAELRALRKFLRAVGAPLVGAVPRSPNAARAPTRGAPTIQSLTILSLPVRDLYGAHWSTTGRCVPDAATPDEA